MAEYGPPGDPGVYTARKCGGEPLHCTAMHFFGYTTAFEAAVYKQARTAEGACHDQKKEADESTNHAVSMSNKFYKF
jgi:hypothetical protein